MSRMLTFLLALFPKLAKLFFLWKQPPLLCFSLVIFLLLIGVGFGPNLVPSWGCLNLVSCAFICFIGSFEPFRTSSSRLFVNSLTKLSNTWWTSWHGTYSSCCCVSVCTIFEVVIHANGRFLLALRGFWRVTSLPFRSLHMPLVHPIFSTHGRNFRPLGKASEYKWSKSLQQRLWV